MTPELFDPETGEVHAPPAEPGGECPNCAAQRAITARAVDDLRGAERELRSQRRKVRALEEELRQQRRDAPEAQIVQTIFRFWVSKCGKNPKTTKLGDKRHKAVLARLRDGHSPEFIMRAIEGAAVACYVDPATGQRYDDLELICRSEVNLERFHEKAERLLPAVPVAV